jgi:hypothetical protein
MTSQQRDLLLALISNPPSGSKLEAAKQFGYDLTLFASSLDLSPTERARHLSEVATFFDTARVSVRRNPKSK